MSLTRKEVEEKLKEVKYPGFSRDIVSFGLIKGINYRDGRAAVSLNISTADPHIPEQVKKDVEKALSTLDEIKYLDVNVEVTKPLTPGQPQDKGKIETMKGVRRIIAVASGKGGVGKSTVASNLACALDKTLSAGGKPNSVGIMDCDIYGPSIPLMMGAQEQPEIHDNMLQPVKNHGIRIISMGLMIDENTPILWRGPMVMKAIQQFATNVNWGNLEVLIVDLPPGTGDAQLSLVQTIPLDGALIITTPQTAAVNVALRGAKMFKKVDVPLLGVVENMSFMLDESGNEQAIFGEGGGKLIADDLNTELLGKIPLNMNIRIGGDNGVPIAANAPDSHTGKTFTSIAENLAQKLKML